MEKHLMITIPYAMGEEGLSMACRRGELFRNDAELEKFYKQGYRVHNYTLMKEQPAQASKEPKTFIKVILTR
ncbi:MAG: hypothetical protein NVS9B7_02800 [Flavisolibacter sp.]